MHVFLSSQCRSKALARTRNVLDRYATRIGPTSWKTPITKEALAELRRALKRDASKNTSVACYVNDGSDDMKLLWVVGSRRGFANDGSFAVKFELKKPPKPNSAFRLIGLVTAVSGLTHDLGKLFVGFQDKLDDRVRGRPTNADKRSLNKDPIRHEWFSGKIVEHFIASMDKGANLDQSISKLKPLNESFREEIPYFDDFIEDGEHDNERVFSGVEAALQYSILTHHKLFSPVGASRSSDNPAPDECNYVRHREQQGHQYQRGFRDDLKLFTKDWVSPSQRLSDHVRKNLRRIHSIVEERGTESPDLWRGVAIIARACLILADHSVSAQPSFSQPVSNRNGNAFANTKHDTNGKAYYDQRIEEHLFRVADDAARWAYRFYHHDLQGVSSSTREVIDAPAGEGRFQWQDFACEHLQSIDSQTPSLVLNMAGTGSGKTRMNVRALSVLREDQALRIAAGFNLRSLTLQTGDAFRNELGMLPHECSCVVGDRFIKEMAENNQSAAGDEDCEAIQFETSGDSPDVPEWLERFIRESDSESSRDLIGAPVLVSTMDYLDSAGCPSKQSHHGKALMRIASSDLIVDEIDSYDTRAIVAVCRVIEKAAMFGRHVVISSATVSAPILKAVLSAFNSGVRMHHALYKSSSHASWVTMIDDTLTPEAFDSQSDDAVNRIEKRLNDIAAHVRDNSHRLAYIEDVSIEDNEQGDPCSYASISEAVGRATQTLHQNTKWHLHGRSVSFGVVRVANIKTAIALAKSLSERPDMVVTTYHANDLKGRRLLKERQLDRLFSRKSSDAPNAELEADPFIRDSLQVATQGDVSFVVIATPVEEVGRDHDFDWAVIEPSSIQSIIQLSGRVNRHRLVTPYYCNVAILNKNRLLIRNEIAGCPHTECFIKPGHEVDGSHGFGISERIMSNLICNQDRFPINAALRFGRSRCSFAELDDDCIEKEIIGKSDQQKTGVRQFSDKIFWVTQFHYNRFPLRDKSDKERLRVNPETLGIEVMRRTIKAGGKGEDVWERDNRYGNYIPMNNPQWLTCCFADLSDLIKDEEAFEFSDYRDPHPNADKVFYESFGFF